MTSTAMTIGDSAGCGVASQPLVDQIWNSPLHELSRANLCGSQQTVHSAHCPRYDIVPKESNKASRLYASVSSRKIILGRQNAGLGSTSIMKTVKKNQCSRHSPPSATQENFLYFTLDTIFGKTPSFVLLFIVDSSNTERRIFAGAQRHQKCGSITRGKGVWFYGNRGYYRYFAQACNPCR